MRLLDTPRAEVTHESAAIICDSRGAKARPTRRLPAHPQPHPAAWRPNHSAGSPCPPSIFPTTSAPHHQPRGRNIRLFEQLDWNELIIDDTLSA